MTNKITKHVWIWMQDDGLYKVIYSANDRTLIVYNERDERILIRDGVTPAQFRRLQTRIVAHGAKRLDGRKEPFTYL